MEPIIRLVNKKLHISRVIAVPVLLIIIVSIIVTLIVLSLLRLIEEIRVLIIFAPGFMSKLYAQINSLVLKVSEYIKWLPPEIPYNLGSAMTELSNTITSFGKAVLKGAYVTAVSLPEAILFTMFTILATFFMAKDRGKIRAAIERHLPDSWLYRIAAMKKDIFSALFGYIRAALVMMLFTFVELFTGFSILHIKYALLLAFLIAIIDVLPILGAGGVLIPWSLYSFVTGNIKMGIALLILYVIVLAVRHMVEPRIIGQQIGVHPLITLLSMYAGLRLAGFAGLIIGPITFLLVRNILKTIYKNKPFKEIICAEPAESDKDGVQ